MARSIDRLSPKAVANAKLPAGRRQVFLCDGYGLYLQVTAAADGRSVCRNWVFRYERDGVRHEMGLGALAVRGLKEAREKAKELRLQLADDLDPLEEKRRRKRQRLAEQARTVTFEQCAKSYLTLHENGWKNPKHRKQWRSTLQTYAFPTLGKLAVTDVDQAAILKVVQPLWMEKTETAARVRGRIEAILDYAIAHNFRTGDNPARHVAAALPARGKVQKVRNHPALAYSEMPDFMRELRERDSTSARALEFTVLSAARTGEVIGATWDEVDLKEKTWTIPANRMKSGRPHRVPLMPRMLEILKGLPRRDGPLFPLSNMAMLQLLRGMRPGVVPHGFRSTFRTWSAERTNFAREVCEQSLAHIVSDAIERTYQRGTLFEKRRRLMAAWSDFCTKPPVEASDTVVALRKRGAP